MRQTSVAIVVTHARTPTLNSRSRHRGASEASRHASRFGSPLSRVAAHPAQPLTPRVFLFLRAPQVDRCFPLEQAVEGHDYLEAGKSRGKVLYEI